MKTDYAMHMYSKFPLMGHHNLCHW